MPFDKSSGGGRGLDADSLRILGPPGRTKRCDGDPSSMKSGSGTRSSVVTLRVVFRGVGRDIMSARGQSPNGGGEGVRLRSGGYIVRAAAGKVGIADCTCCEYNPGVMGNIVLLGRGGCLCGSCVHGSTS